MTDKQIIDRVNVKECKYYCNGKCERYEEFVEADYANYSVKCICEKENDLFTYDICDYQQLKRKELECEELRQYHNKCCEEFEKEKKEWLEKYNQVSKDFYSGKYCNAEKCQQLDQLKAENDNLKSLIWWIHVGAEGADKATTEYYENRNTPYEENYWKRIRALRPLTYESKYKLALTEIKEIAEKQCVCGVDCIDMKQILQKISECEGNNE